MLEIIIPETEYFNEELQEFSIIKEQVLHLEHSLISVSKWEAKWKKPFLSKDDKTEEEIIDYIKCMTIDKNINPLAYYNLNNGNLEKIRNYIDDSMTATTIRHTDGPRGNNEIITSELIYYWMIALNIPQEYQCWHLNRLLTLIQICNIKNQPGKKMSKQEILSRNKALNEARRQQLHSKG